MKKFSVILIGAGNRGTAYATHMKELSEKFNIIGVAESIPARRNHIKNMFNIPDENCFDSYEQILALPKFADIAIIATMDHLHTAPALMAIEKGYNLLLEKPVAQTPEECIQIAKAADEKGVSVLVCHVLRYTPFYKTIKQIIMEGLIGDVVSVIAVEAVGNIHQSHSYVRGDWHREDETTPMLLAKCCHDLDIIQWLIGKKCKKVSSFGDLVYFRPENAPEGAPKYCYNTNCPAREKCCYDVTKVYLENETSWMRRAVGRGFAEGPLSTNDEIKKGLENTNFGACVFHANNNVVDHQVVNMEFDGTVTAQLTMNAFNRGGRYIRIFGTAGELFAYANATEITVWKFGEKENISYPIIKTEESIAGGHGGGDAGIVYELYDYLAGNYDGYCAADINTSVKNHLIGFAAENARHNDTVENIKDYCKRFNFEY